MFVGLNPSTAEGNTDDPTVRRFTGFARKWGYSGVYVLNLFAYRATLPSGLKNAPDPVGELNDQYLNLYREKSEQVVVAWGVHGAFRGRAGEVLLEGILGDEIYCLGLTKEGYPRHPLYLRGDTERERYLWNKAANNESQITNAL